MDEKLATMKRCPYCFKFGRITSWTDFGSIPTYLCRECGHSWNGILPIQEPYRAKPETEKRMDKKTIKVEEFPEPARSVLTRGERAELIPIKNGEVKVMRVRREEVKK